MRKRGGGEGGGGRARKNEIRMPPPVSLAHLALRLALLPCAERGLLLAHSLGDQVLLLLREGPAVDPSGGGLGSRRNWRSGSWQSRRRLCDRNCSEQHRLRRLLLRPLLLLLLALLLQACFSRRLLEWFQRGRTVRRRQLAPRRRHLTSVLSFFSFFQIPEFFFFGVSSFFNFRRRTEKKTCRLRQRRQTGPATARRPPRLLPLLPPPSLTSGTPQTSLPMCARSAGGSSPRRAQRRSRRRCSSVAHGGSPRNPSTQ